MTIVRQFIRYTLVGGLGTVAHLAMLAMCVERLGWHPVTGASAGFFAAIFVSFILNHRWAFSSRRTYLSGFWRYFVVSCGGLVLNAGMMMALVTWAHIGYFAAQLYVIVIVPICNFFINRYWTFDTTSR